MPEQQERDVIAQRVIVSLGDKKLPPLLEMDGVGNICIYRPVDESSQIGGFDHFRPDLVRLTFADTKNKTLAEIGSSEEKMQADYQMTVDSFGPNAKVPISTSTLTNVRFKSITRRFSEGRPIWEAEAYVASIVHA